MLTDLFHLHALSALHVGVGQAVGSIDLPIARSKATNLPLVPGSALKGVMRDEFAEDGPLQKRLFGPEKITGPEDAHAGALAFGDAHLLLMPVRSLTGVMAWATCPFVLARYAADARRAGSEGVPEKVTVAPGSACLSKGSAVRPQAGKAVFDDLDLEPTEGADAWAEFLAQRIARDDGSLADQFRAHLAIVADDDFAFLAETSTEVRARIRINDERGTVARGALWYEENLPAESVLWGVMGYDRGRDGNGAPDASSVRDGFRAALSDRTALIQIGGKATVGRGLVRFLLEGTP